MHYPPMIEENLGSCQAYTMEDFGKNCQQYLTVNYFCKRAIFSFHGFFLQNFADRGRF